MPSFDSIPSSIPELDTRAEAVMEDAGGEGAQASEGR